jgi:hypothetical protein
MAVPSGDDAWNRRQATLPYRSTGKWADCGLPVANNNGIDMTKNLQNLKAGRSLKGITAEHNEHVWPRVSKKRGQSDRREGLVEHAREANHCRLIRQNPFGALGQVGRNDPMTQFDHRAAEVRCISERVRRSDFRVGDGPFHEALDLLGADRCVEDPGECKLV